MSLFMIRHLEAKDLKEIEEMIIQEGIKLEKEEMFPANTFVWDDGDIKGFFHITFTQGFPFLKNLVIKKTRRLKQMTLALDGTYMHLLK